MRPEKPVGWQRVGLAVEYGIRIRLGAFDFPSSMAACGLRSLRLDPFMEGMAEPCDEFAAAAGEWIARARTNKAALSRLCLTLARLDPVGRVGLPGLGSWTFSSLKQMTRVSSAEAEDVSRLVLAAMDLFADERGLPMADNPAFGNPVMAADGDFILGGCLYEVKTTVNSHFPADWRRNLSQLIVYALLDRHDRHGLHSVGVVLPRQSLVLRWRLEDLLAHPLDHCRSQFNGVLEEMAVAELGWDRAAARACLASALPT